MILGNTVGSCVLFLKSFSDALSFILGGEKTACGIHFCLAFFTFLRKKLKAPGGVCFTAFPSDLMSVVLGGVYKNVVIG